MAQTLRIPNFSRLNIKETSKLDADAAIAATSLTIAYTDNISTNDYLYIGNFGAESSECKAIATVPNATSLTIAALTKAHSRFDPIATLFGNQIKVYRASNADGTAPADADFALLGSAFAIDFDQVNTDYTDSTGSSSYWYKFTYYNSQSTNETSLADAVAVRGGGVGDYASIESIRNEAGLNNNRWVGDDRIDEKRQSAQAFINSKLTGIYELPFETPINPLIQEITRLLAAGYLLTDNYGAVGTLNTNEGQQKIDRVTNKDGTGILDRLKTGELSLTDTSGASIAIPGTAGGFGGWPDTTTSTTDADSGGATRAFRMSDRF